jgi:clan AA aspartic protease
MITGRVTADRQTVIRMTIRGKNGRDQEVEAVLDTGFDGWLSLPPALLAELGFEWRRRGRAFLADGSESVFDIYEGVVIWDGQPCRVPIHGADVTPLVGMSLLDGYEINIQVRPSGNVTIRRLTS